MYCLCFSYSSWDSGHNFFKTKYVLVNKLLVPLAPEHVQIKKSTKNKNSLNWKIAQDKPVNLINTLL